MGNERAVGGGGEKEGGSEGVTSMGVERHELNCLCWTIAVCRLFIY